MTTMTTLIIHLTVSRERISLDANYIRKLILECPDDEIEQDLLLKNLYVQEYLGLKRPQVYNIDDALKNIDAFIAERNKE